MIPEKGDVMTNYNIEPKVGVGVYVFKNEMILMQQRQGSHGSNTWAPPGGKVDPDETPEKTAIREVMEETTLEISNPKFIGSTDDYFESEGLHFITHHYAARIIGGIASIVEPKKCSALEWWSVDELVHKSRGNLFLTVQNLLDDSVAVGELQNFAANKD